MTSFPRLARSLICITLATFPVVAGCGAQTVTETGNPPFIDEERLEVELDDGIRVEGRSGATPGGASVTLRTIDGSASASSTSAADGSFTLSLSGGTETEYELVVESDGETETLRLGDSGEDSNDEEPPSPSEPPSPDPERECSAIGEALAEGMVSLRQDVDVACNDDADCVLVDFELPCLNCTSPTPASLSGAERFREGEAELGKLCDESAEQECVLMGPALCLPPPEVVPACVENSCVAAPPGSPCNDIAAQGWNDLENFADGLGRSCMADTDCEIVQISLTCTTCGSYAAVNQDQAATLDAELGALIESTCVGFSDLACEQVAGCPVLPSSDARCVFDPSNPASPAQENPPPGECQIVERDLSCQGRINTAREAVILAVTDAQQGCSEDADCDLISDPTLSCLFDYGTCGQSQAVALEQLPALEARLADLEIEMCAPFEEAECPAESNSCPPNTGITTARCDMGTCRAE